MPVKPEKKALGLKGPNFTFEEIPLSEFPYREFYFRLKRNKSGYVSYPLYGGMHVHRVVDAKNVKGCVRAGEYRERIMYCKKTTYKKCDVADWMELFFKKSDKYYAIKFNQDVYTSEIEKFINEYKERIVDNPDTFMDEIIFLNYI